MLKQALKGIPIRIEGLLKDYEEDLEQAWIRCGEEPLTISFSAKIGVARGKNICEVSISFVKEKIKDSQTFEWSNVQGKLFETIEKIDKKLKDEGLTMTVKARGHESVTLGDKDIHETAS